MTIHHIQHDGKTVKVSTSFEYPPIPIRDYDWSAVIDGEYDGAPDAGPQCHGRGRTEEAAIADLLVQIEERDA